jgi:hypothetical protein
LAVLSLDKTWSGELAGTSKGQMLGTQSESEKGSGGYVAIERFTGTVQAKKGSFSLQHHGTMGGGRFEINVLRRTRQRYGRTRRDFGHLEDHHRRSKAFLRVRVFAACA